MNSPGAASAPGCELIIFDFDGTLSDSEDWFLSIADEVADRFALKKVSAAEIDLLRGKPTGEVIRYLGISRWRLPGIARFVQARFGEDTDRIRLFPGVSDMLAALGDAGIRIAICTSNNEHNARAILGPQNIARIEAFECGASLFGKARKFRRIMKRLRVDPARVVSIGDETRDIAAARRVGIACGAVLWGYAKREVLSAMEPDMLFEQPGDIPRAILGHDHI